MAQLSELQLKFPKTLLIFLGSFNHSTAKKKLGQLVPAAGSGALNLPWCFFDAVSSNHVL